MDPALMASEVDELVSLKSEPLPDRPTTIGLVAVELLIVTDPLVWALAVGVKVTLTEQVVCGWSKGGQAFVWAKGPEAEMPVTPIAPVPVFVSLIFCGVLVVPTI